MSYEKKRTRVTIVYVASQWLFKLKQDEIIIVYRCSQ